MQSYNKIIVSSASEGELLNITLNAPPGNILDIEMITEISSAVEQNNASNLKALVFQGAGKNFSYGASIQEHQKQYATDLLKSFHNLLRRLIEIGKPTFAVVNGQCLGGGLELAAFCNFIFAAEDAVFGQPEVKLAVFPPVGSLILPYRIGQNAADDWVISGRSISVEEAAKNGLLHSVAAKPDAELQSYLDEHILPKSAIALQYAAKVSRFQMYNAFLENIDKVEKMYLTQLMQTKDANEGVAAFLEKRNPHWRNS